MNSKENAFLSNLDIIDKDITTYIAFQEKSFNLISTLYSNLPPIIKAFPIRVISPYLQERANKIWQTKMKRNLSVLTEEFKEVREASINKEYLNTEEFFDFFQAVWEKMMLTKNEERLKTYSKILKADISDFERKNTYAENTLKIFDSLTEDELNFSKYIYKEMSKGKKNFEQLEDPDKNELLFFSKPWDSIQNECARIFGKTYFDIVIKHLEHAGIISEITGMYYDYTGGTYTITNGFIEIMEWLGIEK